MSKVKHVSFEELAGNLADILNMARTEHISIVVEYADGEKLLIRPFSPPRPQVQIEQNEGAIPVVDDGTPQHSPNQVQETENESSVGAVYEFDPNSITPG